MAEKTPALKAISGPDETHGPRRSGQEPRDGATRSARRTRREGARAAWWRPWPS